VPGLVQDDEQGEPYECEEVANGVVGAAIGGRGKPMMTTEDWEHRIAVASEAPDDLEPEALRERISNDVKAAAADPTITARLLSTGQVVNPGGPAEFGAAIDAQRAQVAATGQLLGIKPASN